VDVTRSDRGGELSDISQGRHGPQPDQVAQQGEQRRVYLLTR
jgi:hypothetical protein